MAVLPQRIVLQTAEEYLDWEVKQLLSHQFVDGNIVDMLGGSLRHSTIIVNLTTEISVALKGKACQGFSQASRVTAERSGNYYYADFGVFCGEPKLDRYDTISNPVILFEVLSPSTQQMDKTQKLRDYTRIPTLREYVLVSQEKPHITVHRRLEGEDWQEFEIVGTNSELRLESIGVVIPFSEIYRNVAFLEEEG